MPQTRLSSFEELRIGRRRTGLGVVQDRVGYFGTKLDTQTKHPERSHAKF